MDLDKPRDKCGVFGVFNHQDAVKIAHEGIRGLQHRGEESWGEASIEGKVMHVYRSMGLVSPTVPSINGTSAICHTRYSTASSSEIENCQPIPMADEQKTTSSDGRSISESYVGHPIAAAHNGNLTGGLESITHKGSDTRKLMVKIGNPPKKELVNTIIKTLQSVQGAYSLIFLTPDMMIGARDPLGYRPLSLGIVDGAYVFASESCAIDNIGGIVKRDFAPGELIIVTKDNILQNRFIGHEKSNSQCIFELVYIARPDGFVFGEDLYNFRHDCGRQLAREHPKDKRMADMVVSIPSAGDISAIGYHEESGIPLTCALIRNHYIDIGRAFILPTQQQREEAIERKLRAIAHLIYNKKIILIDDSMVSGTNAMSAIRKVREAGAKEVHLRAASPPYIHECFWGVDTPSVERFIAYRKNYEQIARELGADSVGYLSLEGMLAQTKHPSKMCVKCFAGY